MIGKLIEEALKTKGFNDNQLNFTAKHLENIMENLVEFFYGIIFQTQEIYNISFDPSRSFSDLNFSFRKTVELEKLRAAYEAVNREKNTLVATVFNLEGWCGLAHSRYADELSLSSQEVVDLMKELGFRPATLGELLLFGSEFQQFNWYGLRSISVSDSGEAQNTYCLMHAEHHGDKFEDPKDSVWDTDKTDWGGDYRFLAIRL